MRSGLQEGVMQQLTRAEIWTHDLSVSGATSEPLIYELYAVVEQLNIQHFLATPSLLCNWLQFNQLFPVSVQLYISHFRFILSVQLCEFLPAWCLRFKLSVWFICVQDFLPTGFRLKYVVLIKLQTGSSVHFGELCSPPCFPAMHDIHVECLSDAETLTSLNAGVACMFFDVILRLFVTSSNAICRTLGVNFAGRLHRYRVRVVLSSLHLFII